MRADENGRNGSRSSWKRAMHATLVCAHVALAGCDFGSTSPTTPVPAPGGVRLNIAANVAAAPGAVVDARALYRPGGTGSPVTIGRDSMTTGNVDTELRLRADVDPCLRDAEARGTACTVELDVRLRRDGRELDATGVNVTLPSNATSPAPVSVSLYEVASVLVQSSSSGNLESGDTRTYTAVALDRSGGSVPSRNYAWSVQGGITLLEPGRIRADVPGPASLRVDVGGRTQTVSFVIDPPSVATLQLTPSDTSVSVGESVDYRVVARSATGALLPTPGVRFEPCDQVVCVSAADGRATARAMGTATIRAIASGRNGTPVIAQALLRIDAPPMIALAPSAIVFETEQGQVLPDARAISVTNVGGGSLGTLSIESVPSGLSVTLGGTQVPTSLLVRPTDALPPGVSVTRIVRVRSSRSGVAPADLQVVITGRQLPPILVDQETIQFDRVAGEGAVSANVQVSTTSGRTITGIARSINYVSGSAGGWLNSTVGSSTPTVLALQANTSGLSAGTYVADVVLSASSPHQPRTVRVTLTVEGAPPILVDRETVIFNLTASGAMGHAAIAIGTTAGRIITGLVRTVTYAPSTATGWLETSLSNSTTPTSLILSATPGALPPGTYSANIVLSASSPHQPRTVRVVLTIAAPVTVLRIRIQPGRDLLTRPAITVGGAGGAARVTVSGAVSAVCESTLNQTIDCAPVSVPVGATIQLRMDPVLAGSSLAGYTGLSSPALCGGLGGSANTPQHPCTFVVPAATLDITVNVQCFYIVGQTPPPCAGPPLGVLGVGFGSEQFALVSSGSFQMGSNNGDSDERPVRTVSITRAYLIQRTEVTQAQWRQVMQGTGSENPSQFSACGDTCPVEYVSWNDIQTFLLRLNQQDPGRNYRLPSEAEWEYAARAGTGGDYGIAGTVCAFAWIADGNCAQGRKWPVAQKPANAWGLHDMHGNVWEWVNDWYLDSYYGAGANQDPPGPVSGTLRVLRGGAWGYPSALARSAYRDRNFPPFRNNDLGFRLVRNP